MTARKMAHVVVDLGNGDAGKGTVTDWLARTRPVRAVIRFNGGAQAGHNVIAPDGRHHTFSQFGAAGFVPGVETFLSRHFLFDPLALMAEERHLRGKGVADAFARLQVSERALVVTPFHRAANRLRELARGDGRHGSCGMGVGEAAADALVVGDEAVRVGDLRGCRHAVLSRKLRCLQERKRAEMGECVGRCAARGIGAEEIDILESGDITAAYVGLVADGLRELRIVGDAHLTELLRHDGDVVFEGAQGVLIDERRGFHPYTTWSNCTFDNALGLLDEHGFDGRVNRLGVVRAYAVRHGPGPFVTEDAALAAAIPDWHNRSGDWQGGFRIGWFDAVATRYAIAACGGADGLAVTGLDRLAEVRTWRMAEAYRVPAMPDNGRYFRLDGTDGRRVRDIRLGPKGDLEHQEKLTARLNLAVPETVVISAAGSFETKAREYLETIGGALGAPIRIASFGPRATDKRSFE